MKYKISQTVNDFFIISVRKNIFHKWEFIDTLSSFEEAQERVNRMKKRNEKLKKSQKIVKSWQF